MKGKTLVIYDSDALYATRLQRFLSEREGNHFEIISFTGKEDLRKVCGADGIKPEILLVAEGCFYEQITEIGAKHIFILNETGLKRITNFANFNKYQAANVLFQQILLEYADKEEDFIPGFYGNKKAKLIGVYTPITRCFQTGISLAMAQCLGKKGRTLYINFEQYSGFSRLFQKGYIKDLSDLAYFYSYSKDKFLYWLEGVVEHFGQMDYIPPVLTATSLLEVPKSEWVDMLNLISREAGYDYIVLDLSDNVQGIFQILDLCHKVYTITREDTVSTAKLCQFKEILESSQYISVKGKIKYLKFPNFAAKDLVFENIINSDLQEYVDKLLGEDFYE